jgi:hypothetical protein
VGLIDEERYGSIGDRLADISDLLGVSDADLETVRHPTDITKTVRQVTKLVCPDIDERQKIKISTMDKKITQAIIGRLCLLLSNCKIQLSAFRRITNSFLYTYKNDHCFWSSFLLDVNL